MSTDTIAVTVGIDTQSNIHHAAAIDQVGRLLGTREFPANPAVMKNSTLPVTGPTTGARGRRAPRTGPLVPLTVMAYLLLYGTGGLLYGNRAGGPNGGSSPLATKTRTGLRSHGSERRPPAS
jgi:hypothetical protein